MLVLLFVFLLLLFMIFILLFFHLHHCGNCVQARHNKMYCKKHPFSKSPKNRPGRPHKEVIPHVSAGLFIHAPEGTLGRKWFASASQPKHNVPSLSSGLPKRGPGRPRKKLSEGVYIISFCSIIGNFWF